MAAGRMGEATTKYPSEVYASPPHFQLSDHHRQEIVEGSGVSADLVEGRYWTVTAEQAEALGFSENQAREGWVAELVSPSGEVGYQLKPDKPRVAKGKAVKYETPAGRDILIDVHPRNRNRLEDSDTSLWITEGTKKADAIATRGYLAVVLTGVWNWGKRRKRGGAKYGRPELLPCWDHIPLEGREAFVCFDADYHKKQNVALAMLRLCERLTERGAHVHIVSLPGPDKGVDDYLVAGGTLEALQATATPFRTSDLISHAAKPDRGIRRVVENVQQRMRLDDWKGRGDSTTHSLLRAFLELALIGGRCDRRAETVEIVIGRRELCQYAAIGSPNTLSRHTTLLVERGYLEKIPGDRSKGRANRYVLKLSICVPQIERGEEVSTGSITGTPLDNLTPHLRWPAPQPGENHPERETRSPNEPLKALGKLNELVLSLLISWDGSATLRDLAGTTGANHTSKLRTKLSDLVAAGVIGIDPKGKHHARVWLEEDWERRLIERQEEGGELARARRQAVRNRKNREGFAKRHEKADKAPAEGDMRGREHVRAALDRHRDRWEAGWSAKQGRLAALEVNRAEAFIREVLSRKKLMECGSIRLGLLQKMWVHDESGREIHFKGALRALKLTIREHAEYPGERFVYPPEPVEVGGDDEVASLAGAIPLVSDAW